MKTVEPLLRVAEAVVDGVPVDWEQSARLAQSADERSTLRGLRIIATVASLHRTVRDATESPVPAPQPGGSAPPDSGESVGRWGHLRLLSRIGAGTYGEVYRAIDTRLDREVALKLVPLAPGVGADDVLAEARLLAKLRHTNVVTVHGADVHDGHVGLWMELVHGLTLAELVQRQGPLGAQEAVVLGLALCRAVGAVHHAGLLHRDIKPQNVMREAGGRVVLMDFGAGQPMAAAQEHSLAGTPLCMAPEVLRQSSASPQSDIYSVGVLLYYLVTGRYPVVAADLPALLKAHGSTAGARLGRERPDLPHDFVSVVDRAIHADPELRFGSAAEMQGALGQVLAASEVTDEPPLAPAPHFGIPVRPLGWTIAAGVAAVSILVASVWYVQPPIAPVTSSSAAAESPSIAVLPWRNLTGRSDRDHLAAGLTELVITDLTRIPGLRVLSYQSVVPFSASTDTPDAIAARLGVRYLLAGAVAEDAGRVRVTIQLVEGATSSTVWAEAFNRPLSDVFSLQGEVATVVATRLRLDLETDNAQAALPTLPPEALDLYLRAVAALAASQPSRLPDAVTQLERVVELAPEFGDGWAALAEAYVRASDAGLLPEGHERARQAGLEAVRIDPASSRAHTTIGTIAFYWDWDWTSAASALQRAIELRPGDPDAHQRYAMFLAATGDVDGGIASALRAQAIEPLVPIRTTTVGTAYFYARRYDDAIREFTRALDLSPGFPVAHFGLGRSYAALGRMTEAIRHFDQSMGTQRRGARLVELLRALSVAGLRDEAARVKAELGLDTDMANWREAREAHGHYAIDGLAYTHAAEGSLDAAFRLLDEAVAERSSNLLWILVDPRFDQMRADPRFDRLVQLVGLSPPPS